MKSQIFSLHELVEEKQKMKHFLGYEEAKFPSLDR